MANSLAMAGLVVTTAASIVLGLTAKGALTLLPDGSVMPGRLGRSAEENMAYQRRRYRVQFYGQPVGWTLMAIGFALQFADLIGK